jgi:hypothetical protein
MVLDLADLDMADLDMVDLAEVKVDLAEAMEILVEAVVADN